jgi:hypothetical protein
VYGVPDFLLRRRAVVPGANPLPSGVLLPWRLLASRTLCCCTWHVLHTGFGDQRGDHLPRGVVVCRCVSTDVRPLARLWSVTTLGVVWPLHELESVVEAWMMAPLVHCTADSQVPPLTRPRALVLAARTALLA